MWFVCVRYVGCIFGFYFLFGEARVPFIQRLLYHSLLYWSLVCNNSISKLASWNKLITRGRILSGNYVTWCLYSSQHVAPESFSMLQYGDNRGWAKSLTVEFIFRYLLYQSTLIYKKREIDKRINRQTYKQMADKLNVKRSSINGGRGAPARKKKLKSTF